MIARRLLLSRLKDIAPALAGSDALICFTGDTSLPSTTRLPSARRGPARSRVHPGRAVDQAAGKFTRRCSRDNGGQQRQSSRQARQ